MNIRNKLHEHLLYEYDAVFHIMANSVGKLLFIDFLVNLIV